jgi:hypothetical protein
VGGCELFPDFAGAPGARSAADLRAWNQDVSASPRDRNSDSYIRRIRKLGGNRFLHPDFGGEGEYGIPFEVVPEDQAEATVRIDPTGFPDESDFGIGTDGPDTAPIPLDAAIEGGSDRHVLVVREGTCELFELYRAFTIAGDTEWRADATARWSLDSAALRPLGWTSADAAGLPILPGLVRYDEVAAGAVEHAIRVTFERTRRGYLRPATHYASPACRRSLPPMGLRLRLKRRYYRRQRAEFPATSQARPIFEVLYRYGLMVADNGSNWYLTGAADPAWDDDELNPLKDVPGGAFVVVDSKAAINTPC